MNGRARVEVEDSENKAIASTLRKLLELALPAQRFQMSLSSIHTDEGGRAIDRLSESIEINQAIVSSVTAIVVTDQGTIIGATASADLMFGYVIGELAGKRISVHDLVPPDKRNLHKKYFEDFWAKPESRQMGTRGMQLQGCRRDGVTFPVEVGWGHPIFVLGNRAVVASIMRIPERGVPPPPIQNTVIQNHP